MNSQVELWQKDCMGKIYFGDNLDILPTDVWWHTIVPSNSRERTGYSTQKPLGILERIIKVHSNPGDLVLDFFAGSGTTGEAAAKNNRKFILIDYKEEALQVMTKRLEQYKPKIIERCNYESK